MKEHNANGLKLLTFSKADPEWPLRHAVSTRSGGVSDGCFSRLNVGLHVGDDINKVRENRKRVCSAIGASSTRFVAMKQAHTSNVLAITSEKQFGGFDDWDSGHANIDAVVTNMPKVTLFAMAADCALTLFYDCKNNVLAVAHSGWRGTMLNIYENVIKVMKLEYGCSCSNIFAGISPAISAGNYEVGHETIGHVHKLYKEDKAVSFYKKSDGRYYLDLLAMLTCQLQNLGIDNVETAGICTYDATDLLFSHRKEKGTTGRFGLFAYLK